MSQSPQSQPRQSKPRRARGFRQASALVATDVLRAAEERGFAVARLLTHWPEIAGADLAARARPVRMSHGEGGMGATLTLLTTGAEAPRVEMQIPALTARVNACYGYRAVSRIRIVQTAPTGFAEGQASFTHASARPTRASQITPATRAAAAALTQDISDPALRAALTRLGEMTLSRRDGVHRTK